MPKRTDISNPATIRTNSQSNKGRRGADTLNTLFTLVFVIVMAALAAAHTYAPPPTPSCSSSSDLIIVVTKLNKGVGGVRMDVYHEIENGEHIYWSGLTGPDGSARPPALPPGVYRVFADIGDRGATMALFVGQFKSATRCELKVERSGSITAYPEEPSTIQLKGFRGVVLDDNGNPIPHAIVSVFRSQSSTGYLAQFQADENGGFQLQLDKGSYIASFAYQGFRTRMLVFNLNDQGWLACQFEMIRVESTRHDPPPAEWLGGPITKN